MYIVEHITYGPMGYVKDYYGARLVYESIVAIFKTREQAQKAIKQSVAAWGDNTQETHFRILQCDFAK